MKKIKNSPKYLKSLITYDWWKYLILFFVSSIVVYYAFHMKLSLKRYEQLGIFTTAYIKDEKIIDELEEELQEEGTKQVNIITAEKESRYYDIQLDTNGIGGSDILILPSSKVIDATYILQNTLKFNDEFISELLDINSSLSFLTYEEYTYGIKIYDEEDEGYNSHFHFDSWIEFDETYYMFLVAKSVNLGKYGTKSKENHYSALEATKYLIK